MNIFKIGDTDFGIGEVVLKIDSEKDIISDMTITGKEEVYKQITSDENGYWRLSTQYPPKIYLRGVPLNGNVIEITDELLDEYDIALYFMEHNDVHGTLTINEKCIAIKGEVNLWGEIRPLEIIAEYVR